MKIVPPKNHNQLYRPWVLGGTGDWTGDNPSSLLSTSEVLREDGTWEDGPLLPLRVLTEKFVHNYYVSCWSCK